MPDSAGSNPAIGIYAVVPQLVTGPVLKTGDPYFIGLGVRVPPTALRGQRGFETSMPLHLLTGQAAALSRRIILLLEREA